MYTYRFCLSGNDKKKQQEEITLTMQGFMWMTQ